MQHKWRQPCQKSESPASAPQRRISRPTLAIRRLRRTKGCRRHVRSLTARDGKRPMGYGGHTHVTRAGSLLLRARPRISLSPSAGPLDLFLAWRSGNGTQSVGSVMAFLLNRFELIAVTPLICHGSSWLRLSGYHPEQTGPGRQPSRRLVDAGTLEWLRVPTHGLS